jgi:hypothetical protein
MLSHINAEPRQRLHPYRRVNNRLWGSTATTSPGDRLSSEIKAYYFTRETKLVYLLLVFYFAEFSVLLPSEINMYRPTKGQAVAERTAAVIWSVLDRIDASVFLWNVFPLHPHEANQPFSNRGHNSRERAAGEEILAALIGLIAPKRIVAIGNDAGKSAAKISRSKNTIQVRHPSYGGQNEFLSQMSNLYRCRSQMLF